VVVVVVVVVVEWEEETSDRQISMRVGDLACILILVIL